MSRLLSGDAENDLWVMINARFWQLMPQGAFYPLNDVVDAQYFENLPGIPKGEADYMQFAGMRYAFGSIGGGINGLAVILYDPAVFEELALPDPQQLYWDGEWTWDAMADIARMAAADTTGDGSIDRYGIAGLGRGEYFHCFAFTNDSAALVREEDGRMIFTGSEDRFLEAMTTVRSWMDEGFARGGTSLDGHFGVITGENVMALSAIGRISQLEADDRYAIVPLPMGPQASEYLYPSMWIDTALVLPASARHPEGLVQLAEFLYPVDDYYDVVDEIVRNIARDRQSAAILWEMHDNWTGWVRVNPTPLAAAEAAVMQVLGGQQASAASAMAEVAAAAQAGLDELFDF